MHTHFSGDSDFGCMMITDIDRSIYLRCCVVLKSLDNRNKFIIFSSKGNQVSANAFAHRKYKKSINSNLGKVSCILSAAVGSVKRLHGKICVEWNVKFSFTKSLIEIDDQLLWKRNQSWQAVSGWTRNFNQTFSNGWVISACEGEWEN